MNQNQTLFDLEKRRYLPHKDTIVNRALSSLPRRFTMPLTSRQQGDCKFMLLILKIGLKMLFLNSETIH